jgi:hypothetical protein
MQKSLDSERFNGISVGVLVLALASTGVSLYLLLSSNFNSSGYTWGLVILGVAGTLWATFIVQVASGSVWKVQISRLGRISEAVTKVEESLRSALTELDADINKTLEGIEGLATAAESARNQAILTQLTSGADLRRFHGQASTLKHVKLGAERDLSNAVLNDCEWDDVSAPAVAPC